MTPDELEARLAGHPDSTTVAAVVDALREDPDWSVTEMTLDGQAVAIEMEHHPSGAAFTLSRRHGQSLRRTEGGT
jgi:hypothetical protein